jgi:hypothetical protein
VPGHGPSQPLDRLRARCVSGRPCTLASDPGSGTELATKVGLGAVANMAAKTGRVLWRANRTGRWTWLRSASTNAALVWQRVPDGKLQ